MKKTIITVLMIVFQLLSCEAQDYKKDIVGSWEQEYYDSNGEIYYKGEIWTFYSDGNCQIDYGLNSGHKISKFIYEITKTDCSENPVKSTDIFFLKMLNFYGGDADRCLLISNIDISPDSEGKTYMNLYTYGADGNNVFVRRP